MAESFSPINFGALNNLPELNRREALEATLRLMRFLVESHEPLKALILLQECVPAACVTDPTWVKFRGHLEKVTAHSESFEAFKAYYANFADRFGKEPGSDQDLLKLDRYEHVIRVLRALQPKRILDIGAGDGTFEFEVLRALPDLERLAIADLSDISKVVAALGPKTVGHRSLDWFDWGGLSDADVVMALEVIEHVPDPQGFVAAAFQRLRPGGVMILSTPNAASWVEPYDFKADELHPHLVAHSRESLAARLYRAGFVEAKASLSLEQHIVMTARRPE